VIGGGDADIAEYPFKVALISDADAPFDSQSCGATLLTDQWVLTAAHCFGNEAGDAVIGDQFVEDGLFVVLNATTLELGNGQIVQVTRVISHPLYLNNPFDDDNMYDVALLRLAEQVPYPTVTIATEADQAAGGTIGTGVGWGTILFQGSNVFGQTLQEVTLPLLSNEDCLALYPDLSLEILAPQICAGRPSGGVDTCQGDSGGALLIRNETNTGWLQVGVNSWGAGCGDPGSAGVYARMDVLDDWIFANASEDGGSVTVDLAAMPNATANFANVSTLNSHQDDGSLFFVHDFDIAPTSIREVPADEALTFSWEILNTDSDKVCTLSYVSLIEEEFEEEGETFVDVVLGEEVTPITTVDPCVPGENTADFAGFAAGRYNVTLTVAGDNKTRERTLLVTVE
jgi:secreted trypsin-like serine protease